MSSESKTPFDQRLVDLPEVKQGFESRIREFEQDKNYVVKEVNIPPGLETSTEIAHYAREKFGRGLELMKENGLDEFLPKTQIVVGPNEDGKPSIYIVQERVKGVELEEKEYHGKNDELSDQIRPLIWVIRHCKASGQSSEENSIYKAAMISPEFQTALKVDELLYRSLSMWEKTRQTEKTHRDPICMTHDKTFRRPEGDEGILPEVTNGRNIIIEQDDENKKIIIHLVDIGLITATPENILSNLKNLSFLIKLNWKNLKYAMKIKDIADAPKEFVDRLPIKFMVLLRQIEKNRHQ